MRGFVAVEDGWQCSLEIWEREFIAGLLEQVAAVLVLDGPTSRPRQPAADSEGAAGPAEEEILADLDFETTGVDPATAPGPEPAPQEAPGGARPASEPRRDPDGPRRPPAEVVPLLEALLPDASEDPEVAVELDAMTRGRLRSLKHERTGLLVAELLEPTGDQGAVRVRRGQEQQWLAALNDVRLVLAVRLGIDSAEDAEEVHAIAWGSEPDLETPAQRRHRSMALSYDMLTWWQESLLRVVLSADRPA